MIVDLYHSSLLSLFLVRHKKESYPRSVGLMKLVIYFSIKTLKKLTVQALAPQGNEMNLVLTFAIRTVDQRVVSPLLCGSHPYPYGSLTYRFSILTILLFARIVNKEITNFKIFYQPMLKPTT